MTVRAKTPTSVDLPVGDVWCLVVSVTDSSGAPVVDAPTVAVTDPAGVPSTPAAESVATGIYRAQIVTTVTGRYTARVTTLADGAVDFAAWVTAVDALPDVDAVDDYLGQHSWDPEVLADALAAETDAQRRVCDVPAAYPNDLREALLRRVQVNLAKRGQPFLTIPDSEVPALIPRIDAEVRRFEAPFRKLVMG